MSTESVEAIYGEAGSYVFWEDLGVKLRLHHTSVALGYLQALIGIQDP